MTDIGSTLREARMRLKIDISEVETRTKIRAKYLRAIENEEWDLLPGPIYVKSFLKTYAEYLGLDSRMLIDDYKRRYERPVDGEMRPISALTRDRERAARGPLVPPWAIVVGVLVVIAVVLGVIGSVTGGKSSDNHSFAGLHGKPIVSGHGRHTKAKKHATSTATTKPHKTVPTVPKTVKLQLAITTNPVYVCLENGDGKVLIPGTTFSVGEPVPVERAGKLLLTLGNNGVAMKVNGKPVTVPDEAPVGFELTPRGHSPLTGSALPTCSG
jgi:cytoskeleton protein RodZ